MAPCGREPTGSGAGGVGVGAPPPVDAGRAGGGIDAPGPEPGIALGVVDLQGLVRVIRHVNVIERLEHSCHAIMSAAVRVERDEGADIRLKSWNPTGGANEKLERVIHGRLMPSTSEEVEEVVLAQRLNELGARGAPLDSAVVRGVDHEL